MKKILLLILLMPITLFAQKKKTVSEAETVKNKAKIYFKTVYVPLNFKDKYSYQLMDISVLPETFEAVASNLIRNYKTDSLFADTAREYGDYQSKKRDYERSLNFHNYDYKNDTTSSAAKTSYSNLQYQLKEVQALKEKYLTILSKKAEVESLLKQLSPTERKKISHYTILLDCYANNSYGNKVLGKYIFEMTRGGELKGEIRRMEN